MKLSDLQRPFKLDLRSRREPKVLLHDLIPLALSGINPRRLLGKDWWEVKRSEVYKSNGFACLACGSLADRLEAHEQFTYSYQEGARVAKFVGTIPLCHKCHMSIHADRLRIRSSNGKLYKQDLEILQHGLRVILDAGLRVPMYKADRSEMSIPFWKTFKYWTRERVVGYQATDWVLDLTLLKLTRDQVHCDSPTMRRLKL